METDPHPKPAAQLLEFARIEFFHIMRQQSYIRMLGISIMAVVTPIFLSLLFQYDHRVKISRVFIESMDVFILVVIGLSFVYAVLGQTYTTLSRRRSQIARSLERLLPGFDVYVRGAGPRRSSLIQSARRRAPVWTLITERSLFFHVWLV